MSSRVNGFSESIKRKAAARAGHKCSFPGCGRTTSGPSQSSPHLALENGWACHIYPAAPGGPRAELTPEDFELDSITNLIWLCETHGSLIDKNRGVDYSPALLLKWREQAESEAAVAQGTGLERSHPIHSITIEKSEDSNQRFEFSTLRIDLSRFTLIYSRESFALHMICNAIAKAPKSPEEVILDLDGKSLAFALRYSNAQRSTVRVSFTPETAYFWEGGAAVISIDGAYEAILVNQDSLSTGMTPVAESILHGKQIRSALGREPLTAQDPLITEKLAGRIKDEDNVMTRDIRLSGRQWLVRSRTHKLESYFVVGTLSSSEQLSVHLDLTLSALRIRAKRTPNFPFLLILDDVLWRYDDEHLARFVAVCDRLPTNIQVLVADSSERTANQLPALRQDILAEKKADQSGFLIHSARM